MHNSEQFLINHKKPEEYGDANSDKLAQNAAVTRINHDNENVNRRLSRRRNKGSYC